jgi:raffinose/stachyose/melibiose transport system substrate-binding protein
MSKQGLSRRDFLRYGAGTVVGAAVLPGLARSGLLAGIDRSVLRDATPSYTFTWWSYITGEQNLLKPLVSGYNKVGKGHISLNVSTLPGSGATLYPSKIQSLITSGKAPDVFRDWVGTLASPFIDEGAVQPLTGWYKQYGWDKILAAPAVNFCTSHGQPYGVPVALNSVAVWYYKPAFEKAGVSVPTTYDEWEKVNAKMLKAGITPAGEAAIDGWDVMRLYEHLLEVTAGPKLHDQLLALETSWDNPAVVEAFALLKKWSDQGWLEKGWLGTNPNDSSDLFVAGKVAQQLQGNWEPTTLSSGGADLSKYDLFPPPGDHGPARLGGFAEQYMVTKQVSGARLSALGEFFNWWIQPAQSQKYFYNSETATLGGLPTGRSVADVLARKAASMSKYGSYLIQDEALGTALVDQYFTLQAAVGGGKMTPKEAAKQMQSFVSNAKKGRS